MNEYYIYMLASDTGTLYTGFTSNLLKRVYEHKIEKFDGFSKKYNCKKLVYYEITNDVNSAINREKQLKKWNRQKKENLIKISNPKWLDLSLNWYNLEGIPPLRSE